MPYLSISSPISRKALVLITFLTICTTSIFYSLFLYELDNNTIDERKLSLQTLTSNAGFTIEYLLENGTQEKVQQEIDRLGLDSNFQKILLFSDEFTILASSYENDINKGIKSALTGPQSNAIINSYELLNDHTQSIVKLSEDRTTLLSLTRIKLVTTNGNGSGFLYAQYKAKPSKSTRRRFLYKCLFFASSIICLAGLISLILAYRYIVSPLQELNLTARALSEGRFEKRISLKQEDEMEQLAVSLNRLAIEIEENHKDLSGGERITRTTLDSIAEGVVTTDTSGLITSMNRRAAKLTAWRFENAKHQTLQAVIRIVDSETNSPMTIPVTDILKSKSSVYSNKATTLISKDEARYQISYSASPIMDDSGTHGIVLVFNDISEQVSLRRNIKLSQERLGMKEREFGNALNSMPDALIIIDRGIITFFNQRASELFGYSESETLGENISILMRTQDCKKLDMFLDDFSKNVLSNADNNIRKLTAVHKTGKAIPISLVVSELSSTKSSQRNRFIGILRDLTDERKSQEHLRSAIKVDALRQITGGIAHDFNNMLAVVIGYSDLLSKGISDESTVISFAKQINHAGERGSALVQRLLKFTHLNNSEPEIVNINSLIERYTDLIQKTLTPSTNVTFNLATDLWDANINIDDFEDCILNLCVNALHAMKNSPSENMLTIQTNNFLMRKHEAVRLGIVPGDFVQVRIQDTGSGIDNKTKDMIFEPFFSTKGEHGTGLGMSQVFNFIKKSNGGIRVISEKGEGSLFILSFPREKNAPTEEIEKKRYIPTNIRTKNNSGYKNILVVDDEPDVLDLTCEMLRLHGYTTYCVSSGAEALALLNKREIDLVVSDIVMPKMNGYEFAAIVKERFPNMKIQLLSGFDDRDTISTSDVKLRDTIIYKPFNAEILIKRVDDLLADTNLIPAN